MELHIVAGIREGRETQNNDVHHSEITTGCGSPPFLSLPTPPACLWIRPLVNGQAVAEAPGWIAERAICRRERGVLGKGPSLGLLIDSRYALLLIAFPVIRISTLRLNYRSILELFNLQVCTICTVCSTVLSSARLKGLPPPVSSRTAGPARPDFRNMRPHGLLRRCNLLQTSPHVDGEGANLPRDVMCGVTAARPL